MPVKERSLVAIVKGGLGNQLFIYAAARAMAHRTGRALYLDTVRGYQADDFNRSYRLARFAITARIMPEAMRVAPTLGHPWHKFVRAINKILPHALRSYVAERKGITPDVMRRFVSRRACVTLVGYWQNEDYFSDLSTLLHSELKPPLPEHAEIRLRGERLAACESVFLHVRRVRYSPMLDAGYYQRAIGQACTELTDPVFVVFGDDPAWVRQSLDFGGARVEYQSYDETDELADLWLMTQCRHAIIANSSFSWWAAWLGEYPQRKVWAPEKTGMLLVNAAGWRLVASGLEKSSVEN